MSRADSSVTEKPKKREKVLNDPESRKSYSTFLIDMFMRVLGQKNHQSQKYGFKDSIMYGCCIFCPKRCGKKYKQRHRMFSTSYDKLLEEMDVVEFVRSMRYLKALMKVLLSKREHQILWRMRAINLQEQLEISN